jgi:hypothetical protein
MRRRLLINRERVGGLGTRADDVLILEDCDTGVRKLAEACGWLEELESLWAETATEELQQQKKEDALEPVKSKDEQLEEEVEKLTREVEETLKLAESQRVSVVSVHTEANANKKANATEPSEGAENIKYQKTSPDQVSSNMPAHSDEWKPEKTGHRDRNDGESEKGHPAVDKCQGHHKTDDS